MQEQADQAPRLLARHLIGKCADKLQPYITDFLSKILADTKPEEAQKREQSHRLIYELNTINPNLLSSVLPRLESELKIDILEIRAEAVQLLANMFAAKGSQLPMNYHQLYSTFLGRFKDVNHSLRIVMVQDFAKDFIINQPDSTLRASVISTFNPLLLTFQTS